jgi:hypothetical protein
MAPNIDLSPHLTMRSDVTSDEGLLSWKSKEIQIHSYQVGYRPHSGAIDGQLKEKRST